MLTHETWEIRQVASCGLACFLEQILQQAKYRGCKSLAKESFAYAVIERTQAEDGFVYNIKGSLE